MGEHRVIPIEDPASYRRTTRHLIQDVQALERLLREGLIPSAEGCIGAEQEFFLVDEHMQPAPRSLEILERSSDAHLVTEFLRFNLELNLDPAVIAPDGLSRMERQLTTLLSNARDLARQEGCEIVLTGTLPTIHLLDLTRESITPRERYYALSEAISAARGGTGYLLINGIDELFLKYDSVTLEGCTSSFQLHLQVNPNEFAHTYNIAQFIAGPVLGVATNSPLLFGKRLWRETRIALFQQAMDTRRISPFLREMAPRVHFGTQWVRESITELFEEDVLRFRPLITSADPEDSLEVIDAGGIPDLAALHVHNSTVYRWNRPCYGISNGKPHLRIETRMLPSGPTIVDEMATSAFWIGLVYGLRQKYEDITREISFDDVKVNFNAAARLGLASHMNWPGKRRVALEKLVLDELLPVAEEGLGIAGMASGDIAHFLKVIAGRVQSRMTGSQWQLEYLTHQCAKLSRIEKLNMLTAALVANEKTGQPVHTWPLDSGPFWYAGNNPDQIRVEHLMATDLYTILEEDSIDLAAAIMNRRHVRYVLVENDRHELTGLVSQRRVLGVLSQRKSGNGTGDIPIREIMIRDLVTVSPRSSATEAIALMKAHAVGALPVVIEGQLVGLLTERELVPAEAQHLPAGATERSDTHL